MAENELKTFVDNLPEQVNKMREALENRRYVDLANVLTNVCDALSVIDAGNAAEKYHENVTAFVEQFILDVSTLSIEVQMAAHKLKHEKSREPAARAGKPNILAVDNSVIFLNTLKRLLADAPYNLHCVTTAEDALRYLEKNRPDVFLLDIEMPVTDGYELARAIKQSGRDAPIIFITGNSEREYIDKAIEVGAEAVLMKPLRLNQLLEKLKEIV